MDLKGLKFSKMHGIGNDFVIIDESKKEVIPEKDKPEACRFLCDRHFGVGSDGVLFVYPSEKADLGYRMFNPDGSEAEMCGNGIRCFGDFVYKNNIIDKTSMTVETMCDILTLDINVENGQPSSFKVNMGLSTFKTEKIPMISGSEEFLNQDLFVEGESFKVTAVNVGNPHAIIFVDNVDDIDINKFDSLLNRSVRKLKNPCVHSCKYLSDTFPFSSATFAASLSGFQILCAW
jgi:diaminopimelate epimerase